MSNGFELWGITGVMGAGKSTARGYLRSKGFAVADADEASRAIWDESYAGRTELAHAVKARLGDGAIDATGALNRGVVRARIVAEPALRPWLETTTHPHIARLLMAGVADARVAGARAYFIEGTRLIEAGLERGFTGLITVVAPLERCIERVQARGGMSNVEARGLISTQDQAKMKAASSVVWDNGGELADLHAKIDAFLADRGLK